MLTSNKDQILPHRCVIQSIDSESKSTAGFPVSSHLELILLELEQVWMVRAEQKCAAAGVHVGVGDFLGATMSTTDWDRHFKRLHKSTQVPTSVITSSFSQALSLVKISNKSVTLCTILLTKQQTNQCQWKHKTHEFMNLTEPSSGRENKHL